MHDRRRICLLVLGMHRSGTSAMARVTNLLGADLPKVIMGPNRGNERGHWEPERLVASHDRLLERLGSRWNDWQSLDTADLPADKLADFKRELSDLIDADYPQSSFFVLKEPRLCRLVPFYAQLLREKDIEPRYLLAVRNPLAVMHSLSDRDGIWPGRVALLWLRHALDAEYATRHASRAIVSFEQLLLDWRPAMRRAGARLSLRWPRPLDDTAADITAFLTGEMQHFAPSRRELEARDDVPLWVRQAYRALLDLEINPDDDTAIEALDAVRNAFDAASPLFADALQREIDTRRGELAAARADAAAKAARIKQQEGDLAVLKREIAGRDEKLAFGEGTIKGLTAQVVAQREEVARLAAELAHVRDGQGGSEPNQTHPLQVAAADGSR